MYKLPKEIKKVLLISSIVLLIISIILMSALGLKKQPQEQTLEKVETVAKDSLQILKQDSIKLFK